LDFENQQSHGFGTRTIGPPPVTVHGGFENTIVAPKLADDTQAMANIIMKTRELLPLANNKHIRF
jgi:hypothetical protein